MATTYFANIDTHRFEQDCEFRNRQKATKFIQGIAKKIAETENACQWYVSSFDAIGNEIIVDCGGFFCKTFTIPPLKYRKGQIIRSFEYHLYANGVLNASGKKGYINRVITPNDLHSTDFRKVLRQIGFYKEEINTLCQYLEKKFSKK